MDCYGLYYDKDNKICNSDYGYTKNCKKSTEKAIKI